MKSPLLEFRVSHYRDRLNSIDGTNRLRNDVIQSLFVVSKVVVCIFGPFAASEISLFDFQFTGLVETWPPEDSKVLQLSDLTSP